MKCASREAESVHNIPMTYFAEVPPYFLLRSASDIDEIVVVIS